MADEIIRELWQIKDAIAQEHCYDLDGLVAHLRSLEPGSGRVVMDLQALKREAAADGPAEADNARG